MAAYETYAKRHRYLRTKPLPDPTDWLGTLREGEAEELAARGRPVDGGVADSSVGDPARTGDHLR